MGVSENRGTPKSSILIGFSIINHPCWGTIIFGNTHMAGTYPEGFWVGKMMMFVFFQLRGVNFEGCLSPLICKGWIEKAKDDSAGKIKCVFLRHQNHTYKIMRIVGYCR